MFVPPVVPAVNVLVTLIVDVKQPVPEPNVPELVYVKPVVIAIFNTTVASVVCPKLIVPTPN